MLTAIASRTHLCDHHRDARRGEEEHDGMIAHQLLLQLGHLVINVRLTVEGIDKGLRQLQKEKRVLRSPIGRLVSLIKHMVGVALEKPPSRVRKTSDSPL